MTAQGYTSDTALLVKQANEVAAQAEILWQLTRAAFAAKPPAGAFGRLPAAQVAHTIAVQAAVAAGDLLRELSIAVDRTSDGVARSAANYAEGDRQAAQGYQSVGERLWRTSEEFIRFSGESRPDAGATLVVRDGREFIRIVPRDSTVPIVEVPNTVGAKGFDGWRDPRAHVYDGHTSTGLPFGEVSSAAGLEIATHPTPWTTNTASPNGTPNDALPVVNGDVKTFAVPSPDPSAYTDIVVNYTTKNHVLDEGYVIRFGQPGPDGTMLLRSYGEGNARLQDLSPSVMGWVAESVWEHNQKGIADRLRSGR